MSCSETENLNGRGDRHPTTAKVAAVYVSGSSAPAKRQPAEELKFGFVSPSIKGPEDVTDT